MSLGTNLQLARMACAYTSSRLDGAANWDQYRGGPSFESCTFAGLPDCDRLLDDLDIRVYKRVRAQNWGIEDDGVSLQDLQRIAADATRHRAGNCREYSAVAFMYLYNAGARPLEWMGLDADHAFVMIGRAEGSTTVEDWGPSTVVCDPWAAGFTGKQSDGVYPATQFGQRMSRLVPFNAVYSNFRAGRRR